jgi:hypothetical protein
VNGAQVIGIKIDSLGRVGDNHVRVRTCSAQGFPGWTFITLGDFVSDNP